MTALDFTAYLQPEDSDELKKYKEKVKKVADIYTKRHGWCDEVKRALRDLGIDAEPEKVAIKISTEFGLDVTARVNPSDYVGLDEDAQKAKIADGVGTIALTHGSGRGSLRLTPEYITSMEIISPDDLENTPHVWRDVNDARTSHAFNRDQVVDIASWRYLSTACGTSFDSYRIQNSGENRRCTNCSRIVAGNPRLASSNFSYSYTRNGLRAFQIQS